MLISYSLNVGGIIAATASPAVAQAIGDYFKNKAHQNQLVGLGDKLTTGQEAAHLLAHAVLGAAVAAAGGNNALIGAASAAGGEAAAPSLAHWLYGKEPSDLTADEKQTVSSIVGLAGATVGATTGNSADIASGAQIGQNAVDNNTNFGDWLRDKIRAAAKYFHTEKEAKSFLDTIRNGVVNIVEGAADSAVGMPDYAIDSLNVLVYCMSGLTPSTCKQMSATINPKNQAIIDSIKSALDPKTYSKLLDTINLAAQGDHQAQEATVTFIGSLLTKKKPNVAVLDKVVGKLGKEAVGSSGAILNNKIRLEIDPNKFNYLYGNVSSGIHNIDRSTQLAQTMRKLGIEQNASGTQILMDPFNIVVNTKNNIVNTYSKGSQRFEIRESLLFGPSGKAVKLETSFEVMPNGSRRFITTIPKEGKK